MAKVNKEKFIDAIKTDWEVDFTISNKDSFHFERAYDSNKNTYAVELWDWRNENNPICLIEKKYKDKFGHIDEFLSFVIPSYNKKLIELIDLIEIKFETTSLDSSP